MNDDVVERLRSRAWAGYLANDGQDLEDHDLTEAADEIERLRKLLTDLHPTMRGWRP